jgi:hypothetical protein
LHGVSNTGYRYNDKFRPCFFFQELADEGYVKNIRAAGSAERAGGYVEAIGCLRALQEAMAGLYFVPPPPPSPPGQEPPEIVVAD